MRLGALTVTLLGAAFLNAACGLVSGLDALERSSDVVEQPDANQGADGAVDDASGDGASLDATDTDVSDAGTDADAPASVACPVGMVRVDNFCIDALEVSNANYAAFIAAHSAASSVQPAACSWNADFTPSNLSWTFVSTNQPQRPVAWIDWCDALGYCTAHGKHLCGKIGGGPNDPGDFTNAADSQWYAACSHAGDGLHAYPYGNVFSPTACKGGVSDDGGEPLVNVGSAAGCIGGYAGIHDLSGNVREWEDSCSPGASADLDMCHVRGGGSDELSANVRCDADLSRERNGASAHLGFRCCSD